MKPCISDNKLSQSQIHTVHTLAESEPGFNEGGIRWHIFQYRDQLIDAGAIFYSGRKLLIDREKYISHLKQGGTK
ncbi:MAG: hypothetical protein ACJAS1_002992 [Oleiphilaceae bacterium]|jgi:hypothetical protein